MFSLVQRPEPRFPRPFRRQRRRGLRLMFGRRAGRPGNRAANTATGTASTTGDRAAERAREAALTALERAREAAAAARAALERLPDGAAPAVRERLTQIALPSLPAAELLEALPFRRRPARLGLVAGTVPLWTAGVAALAGFFAGLGLGLWLAGRRAAAARAAQALEAHADEIKAQWPAVTDEDIQHARGRAERLAETIRLRTGEAAEKVLAQIQTITGGKEQPSAAGAQEAGA
jgi:uncharacterized protein YjbJ (UPF0337 family)